MSQSHHKNTISRVLGLDVKHASLTGDMLELSRYYKCSEYFEKYGNPIPSIVEQYVNDVVIAVYYIGYVVSVLGLVPLDEVGEIARRVKTFLTNIIRNNASIEVSANAMKYVARGNRTEHLRVIRLNHSMRLEIALDPFCDVSSTMEYNLDMSGFVKLGYRASSRDGDVDRGVSIVSKDPTVYLVYRNPVVTPHV